MKNRLIDLNNHLFAQMKRLSEESLDKEKLEHEISRTKAITSVATQIIDNARLVLDAQKALSDGLIRDTGGTLMLGLFGSTDRVCANTTRKNS